MGKVHGSLARAGKVKSQTPKVSCTSLDPLISAAHTTRGRASRMMVAAPSNMEGGNSVLFLWLPGAIGCIDTTTKKSKKTDSFLGGIG